MSNIRLEIGDFLGFIDMSADEALTSDQVEKLEGYIAECQTAHASGDSLVSDAVYDRMIELLSHSKPDSPYIGRIWDETSDDNFGDMDRLFLSHPMYSIQTVKSLDCSELNDFIRRLPDDESFDAHVSFKENGWGIRCMYVDGEFKRARTRARSSNGRDITPQLSVVLPQQGLDMIDDLAGFDLVEIRGELAVSFENYEEAKKYKEDIRSPFSAVSSMVRDSASKEEWGLLYFIAYEIIADGLEFSTKAEKYDFLESMGFETPLSWVIEGITKESMVSDLSQIIEDCEDEMEGYDYYTDGLVFEINDTDFARSLGDNGGNYKYCNIALKCGAWKQDMYSGYVQTILWMKGKTKVTPVAIVADDADTAEFLDGDDLMYTDSVKDIVNYDDLGVVTASGNRVRRVPLYEPANILALDAYRGNIIYFRYGGEAGVLPCYSDGTPLVDGRIQADFDELDMEV